MSTATGPRVRLGLLLGLVVLVGAGLFGTWLWQARREAARQRSAPGPAFLPGPYELRLEVTDAGASVGPDLQEVRFEQLEGDQRVVWITREAEPRRCADAMVGLESVDLAARLQALVLSIAGGFPGCAHETQQGPVLYHLRWRASEELTAATEGELTMSAGCLRALPSARDLIDQVRAIHDRAGPTAICEPLRGGLASR